MKVLHFFKTYYPDSYGGIEQVIYQLAEGGLALGIDSSVLSLSSRPDVDIEIIGSHRSYKSKLDLHIASTGFSLSALKKFKSLAAQADIVHYHFPWPFMDLAHFACQIKTPSILSYHSDIVKQKYLAKIYSPLMYSFLGSMDHIVASSPNYLATSPVLQRYTDKVSVIPYGLNESGYPVPNKQRLADWQARLPHRFFLFVGALRYYKGLHLLLQALKNSGYPLVIVGSGFEEANLIAQAKQMGLSQQIFFLGNLGDEDKAALLKLCYAFVFPSHLRSEAFGISLLEAAMFSKAAISCEIGTGTSYINQHEVTGLVVTPEPNAIRAALDQLWMDEDKCHKLGINARLSWLQSYRQELMCLRYHDLYMKCLNLPISKLF